MGILHETAVQTRLPGRTLFNGGCYIISWSPGIIVISGLIRSVFQNANWTLGETKLALWTAEQEPHLTRDGAPDLGCWPQRSGF
jgi:hypothetical protein